MNNKKIVIILSLVLVITLLNPSVSFAGCTGNYTCTATQGYCGGNGSACSDNNQCDYGVSCEHDSYPHQCVGALCSMGGCDAGYNPGGSNCAVACTPVDGGWSDWTTCSSCYQTKTCTNPSPYCDGSGCGTAPTQACGLVNGGWSGWSGSCGEVTRDCTSPTPLCGGNDCGTDDNKCIGYCDWTDISGTRWCYQDCGTNNCYVDQKDKCSHTRYDEPDGSWCKTCTPATPAQTSPDNGKTFSNIPYVDITWNVPDWGFGNVDGGDTCNNNNNYTLCIDTTNGGCSTSINLDPDGTTNTTPPTLYRFHNPSPATYYWYIRSNNGSISSANSPTRSFTIQEISKNCTVTLSSTGPLNSTGPVGPSGTVSVTTGVEGQVFTSDDYGSGSFGDDIRLFVENELGMPLSISNIIPTASDDNPYYQISPPNGGCTDMSGIPGNWDWCNNSTQITLLERGDYYFHCDVPSMNLGPNKCSGNPFCDYYGGAVSCTADGWVKCSATGDDHKSFCAGTNFPNAVSNLTPAFPNITTDENDTPSNPDVILKHAPNTNTSQINITWNSGSAGGSDIDDPDYYDVIIWPKNSTYGNNSYEACCNDSTACPASSPNSCINNTDVTRATVPHTLGSNSYSYTYTATQGNYDLYVAIRAVNTTCSHVLTYEEKGPWVQMDMNIIGDLVGNIYEQQSGDSDPGCGTVCSGDSTIAPSPAVEAMTLEIEQVSDLTREDIDTTINGYFTNFTFTKDYVAEDYRLVLDLTQQLDPPYYDPDNFYTCFAPNSSWIGGDLLHCAYGQDVAPEPESNWEWSSSDNLDSPFPAVAGGSPINFYLSKINLDNNAWFQIAGGNIYAGGNINSDIPTDPDPECDDARDRGLNCYSGLIANSTIDNTFLDTNGFAFSGSENGGINTHKDYNPADPEIRFIHPSSSRDVATDLLSPNDAHAINTQLPQQKYEFFWNKFGASAIDVAADYGNSALYSDLSITADSTTHIFYYDNDLTLDETHGWNIINNQKVIVFVDGNLRIESTFADSNQSRPTPVITVQKKNTLTADAGGYLAFIVSGNINIDQIVGYNLYNDTSDPSIFLGAITDPTDKGIPGSQFVLDPADTPPNIEGVYIADGIFTVEDDGELGGTYINADRKFIAAGTFIGWSGVNLNRSFDNEDIGRADNNVNATETFIYRPDFLINEPPEMKASHSNWAEVAPSFSNYVATTPTPIPAPTSTPIPTTPVPTPTPTPVVNLPTSTPTPTLEPVLVTPLPTSPPKFTPTPTSSEGFGGEDL